MSDLKDLCDRMVADAPPMPAGAAVLAAARRSAARHRRVRLATAGAVAAVVVAVVALGAQGGFLTGRTQPATSASPSPSTDRIDRHQKKMFELLKAALPGNYTISWWDPPKGRPSGASPPDIPPEVRASMSAAMESARNNPQPQRRATVFATQTVVKDGRGEGTLTAILLLGRKSANSDCWTNEWITCEKVTVNGMTLDVKTVRDDRGVQIWTIRDLPDGQLQISAEQSYSTFEDANVLTPKLEPFPFTPQWIAERATDPRFLEVG